MKLTLCTLALLVALALGTCAQTFDDTKVDPDDNSDVNATPPPCDCRKQKNQHDFRFFPAVARTDDSLNSADYEELMEEAEAIERYRKLKKMEMQFRQKLMGDHGVYRRDADAKTNEEKGGKSSSSAEDKDKKEEGTTMKGGEEATMSPKSVTTVASKVVRSARDADKEPEDKSKSSEEKEKGDVSTTEKEGASEATTKANKKVVRSARDAAKEPEDKSKSSEEKSDETTTEKGGSTEATTKSTKKVVRRDAAKEPENKSKSSEEKDDDKVSTSTASTKLPKEITTQREH